MSNYSNNSDIEHKDLYESLDSMYNQTGDSLYAELLEKGVVSGAKMDFLMCEKLTQKARKKLMQDLSDPNKLEIKTWVNLYYSSQDYRIRTSAQLRAMAQMADQEKIIINKEFDELLLQNAVIMEKNIEIALKICAENDPVGKWLLNIVGIGPILACGLMSVFDIKGHPYVSQFAAFCGYNDQNRPWLGRSGSEKLVKEVIQEEKDRIWREKMYEYILQNAYELNIVPEKIHELDQMSPEAVWEGILDKNPKLKPEKNNPVITDEVVDRLAVKSQWKFGYLKENAWDESKQKWSKEKLVSAIAKVPYSKFAKVLMFKTTDSFKWVSNKPNSLYGTLYREFKERELKLNEEGAFKSIAEQCLAGTYRNKKAPKKSTVAYREYSKGKLPLAHIQKRAQRKVGKIFLSHLHEQMSRVELGHTAKRSWQFDYQPALHTKMLGPEIPFYPLPVGAPDSYAGIPAFREVEE